MFAYEPRCFVDINAEGWGRSALYSRNRNVVEDPVATSHIISSLSMHQVMEIEKTRITYMYEGFTVALDTVKHLGDFVEVELLVTSEEDVQAAVESIDTFASSKLGLGVDAIENERYDVII